MNLQWEFSNTIPEDRREKLIEAPSFEEIVRHIEEESKIICAIKDPIMQHAVPGYRVAYCLEIDPSIFDIFFNSKYGYRSWYYRSAEEGLEKNLFLIRNLTQKLSGAKVTGDISKENVIKSLELPSAKAWFAETGNILCDDCPGKYYAQDDSAEILNGRWEKWETSTYPKSRNGRKAPFLNRIRIYGGFIRTDTDKEFVPPNKLNRGTDIFNYGAT
jgi:hypothetical protein